MMPFFDHQASRETRGETHALRAPRTEDVCIPEHIRVKRIVKLVEQDQVPVFRVHRAEVLKDQVFVTGTLLSGELKRGLKLDYGTAFVEVRDVKSRYLGVNLLRRGEEGSLVLRTNDFEALRTGNIISFG